MATIQHSRGKRKGKLHAARDAREGETALVRRWQKVVFITGLALFVMLLLLGVMISYG